MEYMYYYEIVILIIGILHYWLWLGRNEERLFNNDKTLF